jgi:hypothetical protein
MACLVKKKHLNHIVLHSHEKMVHIWKGGSGGALPTRVQILMVASFLDLFWIFRRYALSGK